MKVSVNEVSYNNRIIVKSQEFELGNITSISGKSGSGKTTLLKEVMKYCKCGYVSQDPDNQIVCDKVWHELAFGLENIGTKTSEIRSRVAEVATYLGISDYINKDVTELSGGQKQKVCLAAVLCMAPDLIILDEPTSMLDPISSREFWSVVQRLSVDRGIRFLIAEHNMYAFTISDKNYSLIDGSLVEDQYLPTIRIIEENEQTSNLYNILSLRKTYGTNMVLNISRLSISSGITSIVGPNGTGKTTLLKMITGGYKEKKLVKRSVLMPQDVKMMFSKETVDQELDIIPERLKDHAKQNPFDLSGGEQHILGVYITLMRDADLYCFDEPTKGMDNETKRQIMDILKQSGKNIVLVSHDLDLIAEYSNKVIFLFNREIAAEGSPKEVFENNLFYRPEGIEWI